MKTRIFTLLLPLFITLFASFTTQGNIDEVIGALKTGSVTQLTKFIDDNVEITLPDKSNSYSKAQANLVLKDFFKNSGVKNFNVKHKGDGPGGQFCVGTLITKSGNYRTNVFMKVKGNKQIVKEIRFQSVQ